MQRTTIVSWALSLLCSAAATVQLIAALRTPGPAPTAFELVELFGWGWAVPIVFSITGAAIIARQPANRVGWLLMLPALTIATGLDRFLVTPRRTVTPGLWFLLWVDTWSWIPVIFPVLLLPLHFPSGRPPTSRWRWVNWLAIAMWFFFMFVAAFLIEIGPINYEWRLPNPIGFIPQAFFDGLVGAAWVVGLLAITLGSVLSLFVRYRQARIVEKEQIKWLLYAAALFGLIYSFIVLLGTNDDDEAMRAWTNLLFVLGILAFPVAIAIAILRYRLFDIDVIIRKTAVYGVLTALLALVYAGSVLVLQNVFGSITNERSPLILVISTLIIAALFAPLRRRLQTAIDRRFYRQKYDAQQVLARFALTMRDETDLGSLTDELVLVLQETLQPAVISLWTAETQERAPQTVSSSEPLPLT